LKNITKSQKSSISRRKWSFTRSKRFERRL